MSNAAPRAFGALGRAVWCWFDTATGVDDSPNIDADAGTVEWVRVAPLIALHLTCLAVFYVGVSPIAIAVAAALYVVRMFAITGFYHRYFSHRSYVLGRGAQLGAAILGASAAQRGPLWWASQHRQHHRYADTESDPHSPSHQGFWRSHITWFTSRSNFAARSERVKDLARFPELRWLDRFDVAVPCALGVGLYATGAWLEHAAPSLGTSGGQMFVWGFAVSTVVLLHATCAINSFAHRFGRRRFDTTDHSRNSLILAIVTLGEGWHNNHHRFPGAARQGLRWWEIDPTYYGLKALAVLGIVRELRAHPARTSFDIEESLA